MAKKERMDDDVNTLKGGFFAVGIAVLTGACVAAGRDMYETGRDWIGDKREERRKRKAKAAQNGGGSTKKKRSKSKKKASKAK